MRGWIALSSCCLLTLACVREEKLIERFVEDYCEARWSCDCGSPGISRLECESRLMNEGNDAQDAAQAAGLEYDRECAKAWIDAVDASCAVPPVPVYEPTSVPQCGSPCPAYYGTKGKGEPCEHVGLWSDCSRSLRCGTLDACEDACDGMREGDRCQHGDYETPCAPGLVCGISDACEPPPALGQGCRSECAAGGTCDRDTHVCVEAAGFGEPCGFDVGCGRGLGCDEDVCDVGTPAVCALPAPW